jgi:hypothetical protein
VGSVHAVTDIEFGQDRLDVVANGFGAEVQRRGDGSVTVAGGQQVGNLSLTPGEAVLIDLAVASAAANSRPAQFPQALLSAAGRRPCPQPAEGGGRRLHRVQIAAQLGQRGVVGTTERSHSAAAARQSPLASI